MTAATSTLTVEINARQAIFTLQDIKRNTENTIGALERLRAASSGGFDKLEAAINKAVGAIDRMHATLSAMASGMGAGTAAAVKQAQAMDKLAQAVKQAEGAQAKAAQANRNELADLRATEAAANRKLNLELRIARQLGENAGLQDRLSSSVSKYNAVIAASGANSIAGVKAKGELQREFTRVSGEIAAAGGLLKKIDEVKDAIPKGASRLTHADKAMIAAWAPDMTQQAIASGGNILTPMLVQAPELAQVFSRMSSSTKMMIGGFAGVATAVGVVVAAFARLSGEEQRMRDLGVAVRATGQQGILAASDLAKLSEGIDKLPGVSRSAAEEAVSSLSRIRGLGADTVNRIGGMSADFAKAINEPEVAKAAASLGKALASPAQGVRELNDALGFLDGAQVKAIERMSNQGRTAEAQRAILDGLNRQIKGMASDSMGPWAAAADAMSNAWDRFMHKLANSGLIKGTASALQDMGDSMAGVMGDKEASRRLYERSFPPEMRQQMAARAAQQQPGVLSLPMPAPLQATAAAAAPVSGVSDSRKEIADVLALAEGYRGYRGEREKLLDVLERTKRAAALTTNPVELKLLREAQAGIADQLRLAVDPKQKMVNDAARGARNEWRIAESPYDQRDALRTQIEGETAAREAGLSAMQKEDLIRAKLSESAAKYMTSVQDSVRTMGYQTDATERLAAVDNGSIMDRQRVADALTKEEFRRQALAKATAENRDQILDEVLAFDKLIDRMGKASTASQFKSAAMGYSPTMQYEAFKKDAPGIKEAMRQGGASPDEIRAMYEQNELAKLDASRKWEDGVSRGLKRVQSDATNFARMSENAVTNAFSSMEDAMVQFSMTGKLSFGDMARSIIADLMRIQVRASITGPLSGFLSSTVGGMFGGGAKTSGGSGIMPGEWDQGQITPRIGDLYANGGAFSPAGRLHAFAKGGAFTNSIVSSPTLFKFAKGGALGVMGEAGDEAILPLKRAADGSLGVRADMSPLARGPEAAAQVVDASNTSNISVSPNITVNVQGSSSGNTQQDSQFANEIASKTVREMRDSVRAIVADEINRAQKPGGMMNRLR